MGSNKPDPKIEEALEDMREAKQLGIALTEESKVIRLMQQYASEWHQIATIWQSKGFPDQAKESRDLAAKAEALLADAARLEQLTEQQVVALQREIRVLLGATPGPLELPTQ
jgi:hypothetical protein